MRSKAQIRQPHRLFWLAFSSSDRPVLVQALNIFCQAAGVLLGAFVLSACAPGTDCGAPSFALENSSGTTKVGDLAKNSTSAAQSFVLTGTTRLTSASAKIAKVGSLSSSYTLTLSIYSDSSGSPSTGSAALASGSLTLSQIGSAGVYQFSFPSTVELPAGTYWLVLSGNYPQPDAANYIAWAGYDGVTDGYDSGIVKILAGTPPNDDWTNTPIGALRDQVFALTCE